MGERGQNLSIKRTVIFCGYLWHAVRAHKRREQSGFYPGTFGSGQCGGGDGVTKGTSSGASFWVAKLM